MNRLQKLQFLKDVSEGRIPKEAFSPENQILIIDDRGKSLLNDQTVLSPELIEILKQDFLAWGGFPCQRICHIDSDNLVQAGIKYRKSRSDKIHENS